MTARETTGGSRQESIVESGAAAVVLVVAYGYHIDVLTMTHVSGVIFALMLGLVIWVGFTGSGQ